MQHNCGPTKNIPSESGHLWCIQKIGCVSAVLSRDAPRETCLLQPTSGFAVSKSLTFRSKSGSKIAVPNRRSRRTVLVIEPPTKKVTLREVMRGRTHRMYRKKPLPSRRQQLSLFKPSRLKSLLTQSFGQTPWEQWDLQPLLQPYRQWFGFQ